MSAANTSAPPLDLDAWLARGDFMTFDDAAAVAALVAEMRRLRAAVATARREGAEATRAYDVAALDAREVNARVRWAAEALRNLPLPEVTP